VWAVAFAPRRLPGEHGRSMVAQFLHHFPQYTLDDLADGTLSVPAFRMLYAGMIDNTNPEQTDPLSEVMARRVRASHLKARGKKSGGW